MWQSFFSYWKITLSLDVGRLDIRRSFEWFCHVCSGCLFLWPGKMCSDPSWISYTLFSRGTSKVCTTVTPYLLLLWLFNWNYRLITVAGSILVFESLLFYLIHFITYTCFCVRFRRMHNYWDFSLYLNVDMHILYKFNMPCIYTVVTTFHNKQRSRFKI